MKALIREHHQEMQKDMAKILNEKGYDLVLVAREKNVKRCGHYQCQSCL